MEDEDKVTAETWISMQVYMKDRLYVTTIRGAARQLI